MERLTLFSKIYGEGKPLLILHGLFGMGDNWATHAKTWAQQGYQVHAIDARNHGRSPHHEEHSYDAMVGDLEQYMQLYGLNSAIILGHSMGGKTAMNFAITHPTLVEKLIVVDIAPKGYPIHHQMYIDAMRSVNFDQVGSRKEVEDQLAQTVKNAGIRQFFMKSLHWQTKEKLGFRFNLDALEANLNRVGEAMEFGYYDRPTLFIAGGESGYILPEDHDKIHEHFPAAEIEVVAGAGHWVHAEAFEVFSEMILDFIGH